MIVYYYVYLCFTFIAALIGIMRYYGIDKAGQVIFYLIVFALFGEIVATVSFYKFNERNPVYHFTTLISLFICICYFATIHNFKKRNALLLLTFLSLIIIELININYFDSMRHLNKMTLKLRCIVVAAMSLYSLYILLINDKISDVFRYPHFWFTILLLFLYPGTYFFLAYIGELYRQNNHAQLATSIQLSINLLSYFGLGLAFLLYPKNVKNAVEQ